MKKFRDEWKIREEKYKASLDILGERSSYSKTDSDATFIHLKEDCTKKGQLRAGYNVQVATKGQYILAYDVFPNPTDTRTLIPFLEHIRSNCFTLPKYIVADAGYGSETNYESIFDDFERIPLLHTICI